MITECPFLVFYFLGAEADPPLCFFMHHLPPVATPRTLAHAWNQRCLQQGHFGRTRNDHEWPAPARQGSSASLLPRRQLVWLQCILSRVKRSFCGRAINHVELDVFLVTLGVSKSCWSPESHIPIEDLVPGPWPRLIHPWALAACLLRQLGITWVGESIIDAREKGTVPVHDSMDNPSVNPPSSVL